MGFLPVLPSLARDEVLQLMKFQDLAAGDGFVLVALPAREARALADIGNLVNTAVLPAPLAARAASEITKVLEYQGLRT